MVIRTLSDRATQIASIRIDNLCEDELWDKIFNVACDRTYGIDYSTVFYKDIDPLIQENRYYEGMFDNHNTTPDAAYLTRKYLVR